MFKINDCDNEMKATISAFSNDLKNINLMNHYIGMKAIPEHMPEFDLFPIVIGILCLHVDRLM